MGLTGMGADPMAGGDLGMGADPMAGGDPNAMAVDPMAGGDPMGGGDAGTDLPEGQPMTGEEDSDSTIGMFNQLSPDDKEAARAYILSMLNRDETQSGGDMPDDAEMGPGAQGETMEAPEATVQPQGGVMMEITKGRLKNVQRILSEIFPNNGDDDKKKKITKKTPKDKKRSKGSPFNSPRK